MVKAAVKVLPHRGKDDEDHPENVIDNSHPAGVMAQSQTSHHAHPDQQEQVEDRGAAIEIRDRVENQVPEIKQEHDFL